MPIPATREELCSDLKATIAEVMEIEPSELLGSTRFVEDLGMESLSTDFRGRPTVTA